jgi:hypothetical protein
VAPDDVMGGGSGLVGGASGCASGGTGPIIGGIGGCPTGDEQHVMQEQQLEQQGEQQPCRRGKSGR